MEVKEWANNVNSRLYGAEGSFLENTTKIEFKSGRTLSYLKNAKSAKSFTVNLYVDDAVKDSNKKTEFERFLFWWENTIKSGTIPFYLPNLITHTGKTAYKITDVPAWTGQAKKEVSLKIEEAF